MRPEAAEHANHGAIHHRQQHEQGLTKVKSSDVVFGGGRVIFV
jgi:hypothetical protein